MLLLSRRRGEEIIVPQFGIILKVLQIRRRQVRLGITAPADVQLVRREAWDRRWQSCSDAETTPLQKRVDLEA